jgi:hypothetical protein
VSYHLVKSIARLRERIADEHQAPPAAGEERTLERKAT